MPRFLACLLTAALALPLLTGCPGSTTPTSSKDGKKAPPADKEEKDKDTSKKPPTGDPGP